MPLEIARNLMAIIPIKRFVKSIALGDEPCKRRAACSRDTLLQEIYARENELLDQVDKLVKEANSTLDGQYKQLSNLKTQFHAKVSVVV